jgi:ribosomal protein S18 acetylase RimI-like enzyme
MKQSVTTYYLELKSPTEVHRSAIPYDGLHVQRAEIPCPELNRFLYTAVGGAWYWTERLSWTYQQWESYLDRPEVETWIGYVAGTPAGYFELERQAAGNVEIVYFGLLPRFIGRGIGGALLTLAIERAWQSGATRVWLHTCTLDSPAALRNYQARGFQVYRQATTEVEIPDVPPGPWIGADDAPMA